MLDQPVKPKRVLIVDDEATLVFFLKQGLQEAEISFKVDIAPSGEDALTKLTYNRYDLLITDLKMPDCSGIELLERITENNLDVPVVLVTAFGGAQLENEAKEKGAVTVFTKPVEFDALASLIRKTIGDKKTGARKI